MKYPLTPVRIVLGCYTPSPMPRWLLIFLVVLLPMQLSWAAVASYCQHESSSTTTAQHVGHHEHQHEADAALVSTDHGEPNTNPSAMGAVDVGCDICHAECSKPMLQSLTLVMAKLPSALHSTSALRLASQPASLPERPNWAYLA